MNIANKSVQAVFPREKETHFLLPGPLGSLEIMTTYPVNATHQLAAVAVICHPHPLFKGTMHNKVVTTATKAFDHLGMATVRFNFRGVGQSEGSYDKGCGECEDLRAVINWVREVEKDALIYLAGFSFGSYVSAKFSSLTQGIAYLISIAPPVYMFDFDVIGNVTCPWLIIHGTEDEVVNFGQVQSFVKKLPQVVDFKIMEGASHFFMADS